MAKARTTKKTTKPKIAKSVKTRLTAAKPRSVHTKRNIRTVVIGALIAVVLPFVVSVFVANNLKPQVNAEGITLYHTGQTAAVDKFTLKLNKVTTEMPNDDSQKGNKYIVLNVSMKNKSSAAIQVAPQLKTYLKDKDGTSYTLRYIPSVGQPFTGVLSQNDNVTGDIGFVVPENAKGLRFYYEADAPTNQPVVFQIGS